METLDSRTTGTELTTMESFERLGMIRKLLGGSSEVEHKTVICEAHGEYEAIVYSFGISPCPKCENEKIKREDEERREKQAQEYRDRRSQELMGRAAIPPRFSDRRLSNYVPQCDGAQKALLLATNYAENFDEALVTGASLILCGGVGTGKTHLAIGIAHDVLEKGKSAIFTSVMGAIRRVKETYSKGSDETEGYVIDQFTRPDLLILDEVGVQFGSDTEKLILFEIINGRYERMRPTIVISNLAKDALAQFIGERAFDRLREGGGRLIAFDWPSYRRQA